MNISSASAVVLPLNSAIELRPAELATVGKESVTPNALSSRPVPSVDGASAASPVNQNTHSDNANSSGATEAKAKQKEKVERQELERDQQEIGRLSARDREVRAHEQAHAAVGGQYAGAPEYQFERGPDGVSYAVGGEVSIDVSRAATAQETILKMQVVKRAALAPAEPSPQDRRVAAQASLTEAQARKDLIAENNEKSKTVAETEKTEESDVQATQSSSQEKEAGSAARQSNITALGHAPNTIHSQLNSSILAASLNSRSGNLFDQHA